MWQAQSATAHHPRTATSPPKPQVLSESHMEISSDLQFRDVPSNSNFISGSSNGNFCFVTWINTHAHRENACIVNAFGTSWASRKVAAQDAVVIIHTVRLGGGSRRDIFWASIPATRSAHMALPHHLQNACSPGAVVDGCPTPGARFESSIASLKPCILELKSSKE